MALETSSKLCLLLFAVEVLKNGFDHEIVDRSINSFGKSVQSLDRLLLKLALGDIDRQRRYFALANHHNHLLLFALEVLRLCLSLHQTMGNAQLYKKKKKGAP